MNPFAGPLLLLSLGQVPADEVEPERPATLQAPPVVSDVEPGDQPRRFRFDDSPPAPLSDSPAYAIERPATLDPPALPQQPAASPRRSVVLTDRTEPVVPVHEEDAIDVANQILNEAVRSVEFRGKPTPLASVLGPADSSTRALLLKNYWNLSVAIGKYAFAEHEALYLQKLRRPQRRTEDAMLQAQVARASARRSQARLDAIHWQERLSELMVNRTSELPVPADIPFVGVYRTQIEKLYGRSQAPRRLRQIDRTLPHELEIISRRAESIAAFERLVTELRDGNETGTVSLSQVLQALKELSAERTQFLDVVLSYNQHIADYSLSVVGPNTSATTLLSTLIHTETAAQPALVAEAPGVRRASAEAPVRAVDSQTGFAPLTPTPESANTGRSVEPAFTPGSRSILQR